jgi:peptide methionine sulfoxide reductase msrA/msrB
MRATTITLTLLVLALALGLWAGAGQPGRAQAAGDKGPAAGENLAVATLAGGCFWCTEADFEKLPGVARVVSG